MQQTKRETYSEAGPATDAERFLTIKTAMKTTATQIAPDCCLSITFGLGYSRC